MRVIVSKLWNDPAYFRAAVALVLGVLIPNLPLGELGPVGYWIGKFALPLALLVRADQGSPESK